MNHPTERQPELLAPAGDAESLRAAVANGADAVYFGLTDFNARRRATNFAPGELPDVIAYLHARNVRGYVTLNTLLFSDELAAAARCVAQVAEAGADAVIIQDLGLMALVRRLAPDLPVHASTQATQTEPRGMELLRSLGVARVILARELSLADIKRVRRATPLGFEVFVHGALCVSYSGQCLAGLSLFGRSGNRGVCAQACRLPYTLLADGRAVDLADERYLVSPKDLAAHERIEDLVRLGVVALKIEGRLKSPLYVAAATRAYREALDAALAGRPFALSAERGRELAQGFSRGFTRGYLDGPGGGDLIEARSPRSRGDRIGVVVGKTPRGILVEVDPPDAAGAPPAAALKPGDGVVFEENRPDREAQGGRVYAVRPAPADAKAPIVRRGRPDAGPTIVRRAGPSRPSGPRPGLVELAFGQGDVDPAAVAVGSTVWRTDDPQVDRRLRQTYSRDVVARRAAVSIRARAVAGSPLEIVATDADGREVRVVSDRPLQEARKHPLTTDLLREQFSRLGDTPFSLGTVEIVTDGGPAPSTPVMVPKSVLNDLRRRAVAALVERRADAARHAIADPEALDHLRAEIAPPAAEPAPSGGPVSRYVLVRSLEQLGAVLAWSPPGSSDRPALVWCDLADVDAWAVAVRRGRDAGLPIGLATPRILKPGDERLVDRMADAAPDAVLVRNLGALAFFRERRPDLPLVGDFSLNVANEVAGDLVRRWGLARLVPAADLDWPRTAAMLAWLDPALLEVIVHQHVPLFHMEYCLPAARLSGASTRPDCGAPCRTRRLELVDRTGAAHPILADAACRCTVFGAKALSVAGHVPEMFRAGIRHFRVELLREAPADVPPILEHCWRPASRSDRGRDGQAGC